jgi:hypothetical protein
VQQIDKFQRIRRVSELIVRLQLILTAVACPPEPHIIVNRARENPGMLVIQEHL